MDRIGSSPGFHKRFVKFLRAYSYPSKLLLNILVNLSVYYHTNQHISLDFSTLHEDVKYFLCSISLITDA